MKSPLPNHLPHPDLTHFGSRATERKYGLLWVHHGIRTIKKYHSIDGAVHVIKSYEFHRRHPVNRVHPVSPHSASSASSAVNEKLPNLKSEICNLK